MDDGGQRLLDVIEDTHVLETFLRENFSNSGLDESSRYDNVSSNTESGLVSGGLDSFVFDGQLVDPLRGGPTHTSHHTHQVSPHVLQQVLHPSSLSAATTLSGGPHQLHPHHIHHHHQSHHLQQSNLLQQHHSQHLQHSQHQPNHTSLSSPVGGTLDVDCVGRNRDSCSARNDSDHTLQQLLASASPIGSSQQILQLHHPHQHSLHQTHSQLQQLTQSHHLQQQQHQSHHNQALLSSTISQPISNSSSLLQQQHHLDQSLRQQSQRQHQQRHHSSHSQKLQHQQLSQSQESQTSDVSNGLLPVGLQPVSSSISSCNSLSDQQSPPTPVPAAQQDASRISSKTCQANQVSSAVTNTISTKVIVPGISSQNITQSGCHGITNRVQVVGGHNPVLNSATQQLLAAPSSQLFSGTQIVQPSIPTQVISGGSILAGGPVFSAPNVLPNGQVLSSMPSGQIFQGGQLLSNAQVLTNHLLGSSHVITTGGAISTPAAPLYVTQSGIASHIHQPGPPLPPIIHNAVGAMHQNAVITSSVTPLSSPSTISSFTVPSKSPVSSLPRASPGPSYPATPSPHHTTPSPASYPSKSPAPSPHSNVTTLKSPAPPPSPAVTPTAVTSTSQSTQTVINTSSSPHGSTIVSGVVSNMGMVQGLVPHLPIAKVGGNNGMVLTQGGNSVHVTPGIKQVVPSGQLIQIVSSQNNPRQPASIPHPKPIQPKQPQLLPKPSPQGNVRQPTPPPTGKTLIGSRPTPPNNQQLVLGAGNQQPTVITGQQNLGSLLFNSPLLQGLQQPILIPQPNGVQLLVRPAGHSAGTAGQTLLVPMGGQSQMVTSVGKVPQPQTFVFNGNGQTPAYVIPQGLGSTLTGANMLTATQGARTTQPVLRLVAPQPPFQLQQITTAGGTMYVAVPVGQTALNLPGVFATAANSVRTISPQVGPGSLQIGSSLAPVSLNPIHMTSGNLQVSNSSQPLQLSASLPTPLSSVITTTTTTTMATRPPEESISLTTTPSTQTNVQATSQVHVEVNKNNSKKKSKKKKKEKDSKEDKGKGKGVSINLNELLKETGIFDENEFGGLGIDETDTLAVSQGIIPAQSPMTNMSANSIHCKVSAGPNQLILSSPISQPVSSVALNHNIASAIIATSCSTNTLGQNTVPVTSIPTSMCFTFDVHGKLVLGSSDVGKPHITAIAGSVPTQVMSSGGVGLNLNPGGTFVIGNSENSIPLSKNTMAGMSSVGHLVALHPPAIPHLGEVTTHSPTVMKIDGMHPQFITSKATASQTPNEIVRVAQNTQMIQSPDKTHATPSLLTSLLSNPVPPLIGVSSGTSEAGISVNLTGSDKVLLSADGKPLTDLASNGIIGSHPSQLPINPAVIVSSYANSFLPGAILSGKTTTVASPSFNLVSTTNSINSKNTNSLPISVNIIENNKNLYNNSQYSTSLVNSHVETKVKKSNKKRKREKEPEAVQVSYLTPASTTYQEKSKNNSLNYSNTSSLSTSSVLIHNGDVAPGNSIGIKTEGISVVKGESNNLNNNSPVYSTPNFNFSNALTTTTVTSNSIVSTISNSKSSTYIAVSTSSLPNSVNETTRASMPLITAHSNLSSSSGFIVQPGQQVKQLIISPQNQEALKRVHSQIQDIQNKKGPLGEQDKALQHKLISEYKKIMATGTPVTMSHSSLSQMPHSIATSQHNPIKYSHSVGHKKIFLTPKGYAQSHQQSKKHFSEVVSKLTDSKSKENDSAPLDSVSSTNAFSSHSISSSPAGFTVSVASSVTPTSSTSSNSFSSVQQLISTTGQENLCSKPSELESPRQPLISSSNNTTTEVATNTCGRNICPSMPVIITSTKASPVHSIPTCSTPLPTSHVVGIQNVPITQFSPVLPPTPSPVLSVHNASTQPSFSSSPHPPISVGMLSPQTLSSTNQVGTVAYSQPHSSTSSTTSVSPMRSPHKPLTKDQLFEHQLRTDQNGALNPDYKTPFKNKTDACKRLIRYHVYNDYAASPYDLIESDHQFEIQSEALIKKFSAMQYKYKSLLMKDSMRRHPSSETAMLYRLFIQEEKTNLEREKMEVVNGKELDLPPPPRHWVGVEPPPTDPPFPWEEEWANEKAFIYTPNEIDPQEDIEEQQDSSLLPEDIHPVGSEREDGGRFTSHTEEDEGISSRITNQWEDDFEEECQDEGRLQILMEEETDESKSQEGADPVEEGVESLPSDSGGYFSRSPGNQDDSEPLDERTSRNRHSSSEIDNSKLNNKVLNKDLWKTYDCYSSSHKQVSGASENCFVKTSSSTKENGLDRVSPLSRMNSVESRVTNPLERVSGYNSKEKEPPHERLSLSDGYYNLLTDKKGDKVEKYKHDRKLKSDRERRKHERIKEKSRVIDKEDGREGKSSKKLKIKLKHEDKEIVRPLRIKSDERSCGGGGLKLTLKKQEGSSGYYRVGDERGREYRVEKNDEAEKDSLLPTLEANNSIEDPESDRQIKNVSVVLEDCLQVESKVRKEPEDPRTYKKSKRLKSHHSTTKDSYETERHGERENSVSWSSKFVDAIPGVDRYLDRPRQQTNNNSSFFYQSHQYALESSLSQKQSLCVAQQGQKMIHQSSRSSQRLS